MIDPLPVLLGWCRDNSDAVSSFLETAFFKSRGGEKDSLFFSIL